MDPEYLTDPMIARPCGQASEWNLNKDPETYPDYQSCFLWHLLLVLSTNSLDFVCLFVSLSTGGICCHPVPTVVTREVGVT